MAEAATEIPAISKSKLRSIVKDEVKTAKAANLIYVSDKDPGISRRRKGKNFEYYFKGKRVRDDEDLLRIKHLVIPPAWEQVWICKDENGHLQATGYDIKNRKQYKYHSHWNSLRNDTKYYRLHHFGKALPRIRLQLEKDLRGTELTERKVLAAVVSLMEHTNIRIGSSFYEKEYGSYGLTTLKDKHVTFKGSGVIFSFKGKKGVDHNITLKSKKLAGIVKKCRDIPGKELFQYYDKDGTHHSVDSGSVNNYIKEISNADFTAKDFRTWSGTVHAFLALQSMGCCDTHTEAKKRMVEALDTVSEHLGNTRTVCKKYYVHPLILSLYESGKLQKYMKVPAKAGNAVGTQGLSADEKKVMKILESN